MQIIRSPHRFQYLWRLFSAWVVVTICNCLLWSKMVFYISTCCVFNVEPQSSVDIQFNKKNFCLNSLEMNSPINLKELTKKEGSINWLQKTYIRINSTSKTIISIFEVESSLGQSILIKVNAKLFSKGEPYAEKRLRMIVRINKYQYKVCTNANGKKSWLCLRVPKSPASW